MGSDDRDKKESSNELSSLSPLSPEMAEVAELLRQLKEALLVEKMQGESFERLQARVTWLTRLEATKAEHVLQLASAVNNFAQAKDRNTEALLLATRQLTEAAGQYEFIAGALRQIIAAQKVHAAITDVSDLEGKITTQVLPSAEVTSAMTVPPGLVPLKTMETVVEAMREASGVHHTHRVTGRESNAPELVETVDSSRTTTFVVTVRRTLRDFFRAPTIAQVLFLAIVFIVAIATVLVFAIKNGWRVQELEHEGAPLPSIPAKK